VAQDHDLELPLTAAAGEQANDGTQEPVQQTRQHDAQSDLNRLGRDHQDCRPKPNRISLPHRIPDEVWAQMEALLPERPAHPLGCHNPRVPEREAMNAILLVLRTGMPWNALSATGICSCSSAYRRFREWAQAGVFLEFWRRGLLAYDDAKRIEWEWLAMDGALGEAPLGGAATGTNPTDRAKKGRNEASSARRARRQQSGVPERLQRHANDGLESTVGGRRRRATRPSSPISSARGWPRGHGC
jgi:transposase